MSSKYATSSKPAPVDLGSLGWIQGLQLSSPTSQKHLGQYYGGIPFAQAPVGPLRFRKTRPLPSTFTYGTKSTPGQYTAPGPICPQPSWRWEIDPNTWSEDCLKTNIWVPSGQKPAAGWPVFFYIHGGFLQFGSADKPIDVIAQMFEETSFQAIVVMPAYRVNALGFLASHELEGEARSLGESTGNAGFWDQRVALEWTSRYIAAFGGDPRNITVGGYSAGSHSTFQQLSHDLFLPASQSIIKRAIMWSNGTGPQPKLLDEHQKGFDELLSALHISPSLSPTEKISALRAAPVADVIKVQNSMKNSEFRGYSDGAFISKSLIKSINSGEYGRRMKARGVKLLNGECADEHYLYQDWRTPANSFQAVHARLCADYPEKVVNNVLDLYSKNKQLPQHCKDWCDLFGRIYADLQVHCLERGFHNNLARAGLEVGKDVLRYRIEWRAECVDALWPREWKVSHDTDSAIWWWGNGWNEGLSDSEKKIVSPIHRLFADFVAGKDVQWEKKGPKYVKRLNSNGQLDMWEDERWDEALEVWKAVNGPPTSEGPLSAKL